MFTWYKNSVVCYAYLSDILEVPEFGTSSQRFASSRWFTRGWTLQELLAPKSVQFYSAKWEYLGTRGELAQQITYATGIEHDFLLGSKSLRYASIAKRFSWAAKRETSRTEDIAYCLLGLFDVNMPLLYDEGRKAFIRLQEEIMKSSSDLSLFAWGKLDTLADNSAINPDESGSHLLCQNKDTAPLKGLLAGSPRDFVDCGSIVVHKPFIDALIGRAAPPILFAGGVRISLPTLKEWPKCRYWWDKPSLEQNRTGCIAVLGCKMSEEDKDSLGIPLIGWGNSNMARRNQLVLVRNNPYQPLWLRNIRPRLKEMYIKPELRPDLRTGDIIFRKFESHNMTYAGYDYPSLEVDYSSHDRLLQPRAIPHNGRLFSLYWSYDRVSNGVGRGIAVVFGKTASNTLTLGQTPLYVGFIERIVTEREFTQGVSLFSNCLGEDLVEQQVLHHPNSIAVWSTKHPTYNVKVRVQCERLSMMEFGRKICVDVIDVIAERGSWSSLGSYDHEGFSMYSG